MNGGVGRGGVLLTACGLRCCATSLSVPQVRRGGSAPFRRTAAAAAHPGHSRATQRGARLYGSTPAARHVTRVGSHAASSRPDGSIKIALFMDTENISAENIQYISGRLAAYGTTVVGRCYGPCSIPAIRMADSLGIEYVVVPKGAESVDMRMAFDASRLAMQGSVAHIAICAGDSDYSELATQLRKHVIVHGFHTRSNSSASFFNSVDFSHPMPVEGGSLQTNAHALQEEAARTEPVTDVAPEEWNPLELETRPPDPLLTNYFASLGKLQLPGIPVPVEDTAEAQFEGGAAHRPLLAAAPQPDTRTAGESPLRSSSALPAASPVRKATPQGPPSPVAASAGMPRLSSLRRPEREASKEEKVDERQVEDERLQLAQRLHRRIMEDSGGFMPIDEDVDLEEPSPPPRTRRGFAVGAAGGAGGGGVAGARGDGGGGGGGAGPAFGEPRKGQPPAEASGDGAKQRMRDLPSPFSGINLSPKASPAGGKAQPHRGV